VTGVTTPAPAGICLIFKIIGYFPVRVCRADSAGARQRRISAAHPNAGESATVAGRVAAVVWAVGLVAGLIALATGYLMVAGVTLLVAVLTPWLAIGVVLHSKPRVVRAEIPEQMPPSAKPVLLPNSGYRIRLPAR
jgi:hypothetical protein